MNKVLFSLGDGVYPKKTGGMEIFNFYIIKNLSKHFDIYYHASSKLKHNKGKHLRYFPLRPSKILAPIQLLICLIRYYNIKTCVISYSEAHWLIWYIETFIATVLKRKYIIVVHHGKKPPTNKQNIYNKFFQKASHVIAVSEDIKKNFDKLYGINCKVIFPLVPFSEAKSSKESLRDKYNIPQDANTICMVGSIKGMKNPDTIIEALHSFTKEEMEKYKPHVVFAGSGADLEILKEKTAQYNLSKHITFLGNVPKETVNEIYKLSDFYLIASDFEGTSVSLLEAMFNKIPIITSRAPGIVNTIEEDTECLMFATKDASRLKECILKYLDNPDMAKQYASQAFKHFHRAYNYEDVVKAYVQILNN